MAQKHNLTVAVGFGVQSAEDIYNATLGGIVAGGTFGGDSGVGDDDGLLLGDPTAGILNSGLSITLGTERGEKVRIDPSRSSPLAPFEAADVSSFSFAGFWRGNGATAAGSPVDADFIPNVGLDAILRGFGFTTSESTGLIYTMANSPVFVSALVLLGSQQIQLLNCVPESLVLNHIPRQASTFVVNWKVGRVLEPSAVAPVEVAFPTLDYGNQIDVTPSSVDDVNFTWSHDAGFNQFNTNFTQVVNEELDSNIPGALVLELDPLGLDIGATFTVYSDTEAAGAEGYQLGQLLVEQSANLDPMSFQVGTVNPGSAVMDGILTTLPKPSIREAGLTPTNIGQRAAWDVDVIANAVAANDQITLKFN